MLNGDDLWNTFTGMTMFDGLGVFVFSQFFFTIFLILFIYAILNLFISLIIQSYEESQVKRCYWDMPVAVSQTCECNCMQSYVGSHLCRIT